MKIKMPIDGQTLDQAVTIIISIGLIVSAFLAIHLDEAMYSVGSLACTLILLAVMYWIYQAIYAAIFQLVTGISTLMVLFLAGEMLSERSKIRDTRKHILMGVIIALIIALPTLFLTVSSSTAVSSPSSFTDNIWNLRSIDIVLQGLVILVIAVGIAIILHQKKNEGMTIPKEN